MEELTQNILPLFSLPPEILDEVYTHLVRYPFPIHHRASKWPRNQASRGLRIDILPQIFFVSKKVYVDSRSVFLKANTFVFDLRSARWLVDMERKSTNNLDSSVFQFRSIFYEATPPASLSTVEDNLYDFLRLCSRLESLQFPSFLLRSIVSSTMTRLVFNHKDWGAVLHELLLRSNFELVLNLYRHLGQRGSICVRRVGSQPLSRRNVDTFLRKLQDQLGGITTKERWNSISLEDGGMQAKYRASPA